MKRQAGIRAVREWFRVRGCKPFDIQEEVWRAVSEGRNGLIDAPAGSGKTLALWCAALVCQLNEHGYEIHAGLRVLWIVPQKALAAELHRTMTETCEALGISWTVELRTGDSSASAKRRQRSHNPNVLIATPESLHILFSNPGYKTALDSLQLVVVDGWHELHGTKRGVQTELALAHIRRIAADALVWGSTASVADPAHARGVLLAAHDRPSVLLCPPLKRTADVQILAHAQAGHTAPSAPDFSLLPDIAHLIEHSHSTIVLADTRALAEQWYRELLSFEPDFAGAVALHHAMLDRTAQAKVEEDFRGARLKAVVCAPGADACALPAVENVILLGSPKTISRFLERTRYCERDTGMIWLVPAHPIELAELMALQRVAGELVAEPYPAMPLAIDVLWQYCLTLACSDGFTADELYSEIVSTAAFRELSRTAFEWAIDSLAKGSRAYRGSGKVHIRNGRYCIADSATALRHRMQIGTAAPPAILAVQYAKGGRLGMIEEKCVAELKPGDVFLFAGKNLEFVAVRDIAVVVQNASLDVDALPLWEDEPVPMSPQLASIIRQVLGDMEAGIVEEKPPVGMCASELMVECVHTPDGQYLFLYPCEGRMVHEGLAALLAVRIARTHTVQCEVLVNDYGISLFTAGSIPPERIFQQDIFSDYNLREDLAVCADCTPLARARFRNIAYTAGLVVPELPQFTEPERRKQAAHEVLFDELLRSDPHNLLLKQAYDEVTALQCSEQLLRAALHRISALEIVITRPKHITALGLTIEKKPPAVPSA